ncbi:MAG: SDR family NAD(P)-dependent oxidoreductase [Candidatus Yonathbacteria bacterium]|nr:SDR family NAD(P)-dependent oxidoreductase [Candidatus Yonathbacteria bacterium]
MNIKNKTVLITGASSGIGAAIANAMSRAGATQILLLAQDEQGLKKVAKEIEHNNVSTHIYSVDLSKKDAIAITVQNILNKVGVPDIIINNAGRGQWKFLEDTSADEIEQMMAVPYFTAAWLTRLFIPGMLKRGEGHIVNISSVASRLTWPGATAYIAQCRAMRGLSDALQADFYGTNIHVTHYESGPIDSPYWQHNPNSRERVPKIASILVPVLKQEEVAKAIVNGVKHNKKLIVIPLMMKLVYILHFFFPFLTRWLMITTGYHRKH